MDKRHNYLHWSERGFTLMEVMVVTAIIGILAGIAIPSYLSWRPGYEFRGAVSRITSDLNKAKMRALEIRRECRVLFCGDSYQIIDGDQTMYSNWPAPATAGTCLTAAQQAALDAAGRRVVNISLADYSRVTVKSNPTVTPTFSPRGLGTNLDTVEVTHTATGEKAEVRINQTGRVRVVW